ncbi:hypothetical protein [Chroococcidiopsis sp. CCALA 051]|uniref:hypothetical protein n=1 Tax=Chroococcidiopsis sp. CCALA 051 TaxID=869949 RepID=UPI001304BD4A|nr:hypothetical protein [Chroococcidiopsis sp. CCALA 051]
MGAIDGTDHAGDKGDTGDKGAIQNSKLNRAPHNYQLPITNYQLPITNLKHA